MTTPSLHSGAKLFSGAEITAYVDSAVAQGGGGGSSLTSADTTLALVVDADGFSIPGVKVTGDAFQSITINPTGSGQAAGYFEAYAYQGGDGAWAALNLFSAGGTPDAPTFSAVTNSLGEITFSGYGGESYNVGATIISTVTSGFDDAAEANIQISGSSGGGITINHDGSLSILSQPPGQPDGVGEPGTVTYEDGFLYVCIASGNWQRVAIATWEPPP